MSDERDKNKIVNLFTGEGLDMPEEEVKHPFETEKPDMTFEDVGGMEGFKELARLKIIHPFKNPELFKRFKKKIGGGILLYGPPGCGKTYLSRAIAGECEATFFNVGIDNILDMYVGNSEKNVAALFEAARQAKPSLVFIDEIDALGRSRNLVRGSSTGSVVNTFLSEMDGAEADNDGVLVIGATNAVWDVDNALKRPGRFDNVLFVPPPDLDSRVEILTKLLADLPIEGIDVDELAEKTELCSGADLWALVERSGECVLEEIMKTGKQRPITMGDMRPILKHLRPSTREWLDIAKNYVQFANDSGLYNDLQAYMEQAGLLRGKRGWLR